MAERRTRFIRRVLPAVGVVVVPSLLGIGIPAVGLSEGTGWLLIAAAVAVAAATFAPWLVDRRAALPAGEMRLRAGKMHGWKASAQTSDAWDFMLLDLVAESGVPHERVSCLVVTPDGERHWAENEYEQYLTENKLRRLTFPKDFRDVPLAWPPTPGDYAVQWVARRATERLPIDTLRFRVHPDGAIQQIADSLTP